MTDRNLRCSLPIACCPLLSAGRANRFLGGFLISGRLEIRDPRPDPVLVPLHLLPTANCLLSFSLCAMRFADLAFDSWKDFYPPLSFILLVDLPGKGV